MDDLKTKKLFVLDMDGTVYLGDSLIDGAADFIELVRTRGGRILFFTNNASRTPDYYVEKMNRLGIRVERDDIVTAGDVTIKYLNTVHTGSSVYLVGTPMLEESFRESGIKLVRDNPDIVVVSFDLTMTYEKISKACTFIREGAVFLATHMDYNCPVEGGFIPDCGSICAMVEVSTGVSPKYLGKPFNETIEMILSITGAEKPEMVIVGDRLYTDMAMGVKNDVTSVLVLSGETCRDDMEKSEIKPDIVAGSLKNLKEMI